jgi:hypothetical protein
MGTICRNNTQSPARVQVKRFRVLRFVFFAGRLLRAPDAGGGAEFVKSAGIKIFLDIIKIACYINSRKKKRCWKVTRKKSRRRTKKRENDPECLAGTQKKEIT